VACARDKARQRDILTGHVPVPEYAEADTEEAAIAAARRFGLPVVVKPVTGSGSIGVRLCRTIAEVAEHAARLLAATANERGQSVPRRILVERYVRGPEYSVETFGPVAVGVTRKHLGPAPYFVETGHDFPAPISGDLLRRLERTALAATRRLGIGLGPAHVELRHDGRTPMVIEVNPRLAGGWIPRLVHEATGIDLVTETLRAFSGAAVRLQAHRCRAASIRFVLPCRAGVLHEVTGVEAARHIPFVTDAEIYHRAGETVRRSGDFRDRIGHVIACADDGRTAERAAGTALGLIQAVVGDGDGDE
jgi:S-sulfo-L-cysteine synthase (3-phospho-L-serine-dependent)